jgi:putative inorganic carbon (HCO3(-)) transporter
LNTIINWLGLIGISVIAGVMLFLSMASGGAGITPLIVISIVMLPFAFVQRKLARDVLVILLLFTLPFNIDQTLNLRPEHTGGAKGLIVSLNGIAIVLLYCLLLVEKMADRDQKFRGFWPVVWPFWAMTLMAVASMANAADRMFSLYEILEVIKMGCIFLYLANYVQRTGRLKFVLFFLFCGLFLECGIALVQKAVGNPLNLKVLGSGELAAMQQMGRGSVFRIGGTLGGANALAWYLDYLLPLAAAFLYYPLSRLFRAGLLVTLFAGCAVLFLTLSRGGWLGFLAGLIIILVVQIRKSPLFRQIFIVVFILLALGLSALLLLGIQNPVKTRLTADDNSSAYIRIPLMRVAYHMIKAKPFFGHGINNYALVHSRYDDSNEQVTIAFPYPVHNFYLQLAAEVGLPGLLFLIWFLAGICVRMLKLLPGLSVLDRTLFIGLIGGTTAALIQGMVENASIGSYHLLPLWCFSGLAVGRIYARNPEVP